MFTGSRESYIFYVDASINVFRVTGHLANWHLRPCLFNARSLIFITLRKLSSFDRMNTGSDTWLEPVAQFSRNSWFCNSLAAWDDLAFCHFHQFVHRVGRVDGTRCSGWRTESRAKMREKESVRREKEGSRMQLRPRANVHLYRWNRVRVCEHVCAHVRATVVGSGRPCPWGGAVRCARGEVRSDRVPRTSYRSAKFIALRTDRSRSLTISWISLLMPLWATKKMRESWEILHHGREW